MVHYAYILHRTYISRIISFNYCKQLNDIKMILDIICDDNVCVFF